MNPSTLNLETLLRHFAAGMGMVVVPYELHGSKIVILHLLGDGGAEWRFQLADENGDVTEVQLREDDLDSVTSIVQVLERKAQEAIARRADIAELERLGKL